MNNFPPTVFATDSAVHLGQSIAVHTTFTVDDPDPNSVVTKYRFKDLNATAQSGYFSVQGDNKTQGVAFEVAANLLFEVRYHAAALLSGETISIEAFDGLHWSAISFADMLTVAANNNKPVVTATSFNVQSTENVDMIDYVSAVDPDGYPITQWMFVDRLSNVNGGYFSFRGVRMPSATWFTVQNEDLEFLKYVGGQFSQGERIGVRAKDTALWSTLAEATAQTNPNLNNPVVSAVGQNVIVGQQINVGQMFTFSDADSNTLKKLYVRDLGAAPSSGYFSLNGVQQLANVWIEVDVNDIPDLNYVSGSVFGSENFRVQAWDGRRKSNISTATVETTVNPEIIPTDVITMVDSFEMVKVANLFSNSPGPSVISYDVIDLNPETTSGKLNLSGTILESGRVYTLSNVEFDNLFFQGGTTDVGRSFDEILVRANNGFAESGWSGFNFSTDPVNQAAVLQIGDWDFTTPTLELTYSFPLQLNPFYCLNGLDECTNWAPMSDNSMRDAIRDVYEYYESIINVNFTEVSPSARADVEFYFTTIDGDFNTLAYAYAPGTVGTYTNAGDIFGDSPDVYITNNEPGEGGYATWLHEIGHSMGLDHSFIQTPQGLVDKLPASMQNNQYTIMSYNRIFPDIEPKTMQLYDVMGLQTLYGANMNYNTGNTHIRTDRNSPIQHTVWDAGGIDTINWTNHNTNNTINLQQGQFSSVGGRQNNMSIAWGVDIENARGGTGNDTLIGNELDNLLFGNAGNDTLRGNGGRDTLRGLAGADTYVLQVGDGYDLINEHKMAGRDVLEIHFIEDLPSLPNDLTFRQLGRDLRVDLTLNVGTAHDGITIRDQVWGGSRIETLRLFDIEGDQVGPDISLLSVTQYASTTPMRFNVTANTSTFGNLVAPV